MTTTLVIGYGSTLHSDDAVGVVAVEQFAAACADPQVTALTRHQLLPELAEPISRADRVIFVDAAVDDDHGGGQVTVRALTPQTQSGALVHHVRPESLLGLAQTLYACAPSAHLVTVSVSSLALGGGLSPDVQAALPQAVAHITALAAAT